MPPVALRGHAARGDVDAAVRGIERDLHRPASRPLLPVDLVDRGAAKPPPWR
ncbi:hypothetical protein [Elstera litoralis]|uniref:hypothetical protein n=1 Tax=Elstera litoralis TaxID=552518 RepID=UPI001E2EEF3B|nr:hypothetical protein [Elstera litoralis]